ncbi:Developmental regulatory protein wetA [Metarhizium anisopliae]
MAFWTVPYRAEAVDTNRDPSMYWEDINSASTDDAHNDFFGQFVDFDADGTVTATTDNDFNTVPASMPGVPESMLLMGDRTVATLESAVSSCVSSADEFDFLSSSSRIGPTASAASHEIDPKDLTLSADELAHPSQQQFDYLGRGSMSEADLSRLESISLHSPQRPQNTTSSDTPSPKPPNTDARKPKKFVEALSSTIRKATNLRRNRKAAAVPRQVSPPQEHLQPLKIPKQRRGRGRAVTQGNLPVSPPLQQQEQATPHFIHGQCDDPFNDTALLPPGGRSASVHVMGHGQHTGMPYDYGAIADTSTGGLMIHMPQPRGSQSSVVNDLTVNAQTFLPPPPPIPQAIGQKMPGSERSHRPPKAKSSGARHLSCSPVRKQRGPSSSPTPADQSAVPRSRHSSGASVSSLRSSSGRLPASMPGTPCSVRKRRSRDISGSNSATSLGGSDGASGIGFVNFTPNDGSVLMTGVAPSGSSKTKARREKEAQDRRRRLSEAAIKAVAAAGGDVDKLIEQGFAF